MAVTQFTRQFLESIPLIDNKTVKDFYDTLLRTPAAYRINFLSKVIDKQKDFLPKFNWSNGKDDKKSQHFRTVGNECFVRLEFVEALKYYNKAIAFAKSETNLSICYANRSAVYYELSLFKTCLENIQLAMRYGLPDHLKSKLNERQRNAVKNLLLKLVLEPCRTNSMKLCRPSMQRQPFFINCLTKESDQIFTREPLLAGDVISLEKPYSQILRQSHIYERCTYCLTNKKYMSMVPCMDCSSAMFCDQYCYGMAKAIFHGFECSIIDGLFHFLTDSMYLGLRTVFIALNKCHGLLDEYKNMLQRCYEDDDTDSFEINTTSSDRGFDEMVFLIIHNLKRSFSFSMEQHLATAVLMEKLEPQFRHISSDDQSFRIVLSTSIFHMLQVSTENSILLEETAYTGDGVGNDLAIYGCGLFPFASNFRPSCAPNVLFINNNGVFSGIVIRPIKANQAIVPGIMSLNHFLTDKELRINRMQTFNSKLCHCIACKKDFEVFSELPVAFTENVPLMPETLTDTEASVAGFKMICNYLNRNGNVSYLSWQMGWCIQEMIRVLRQIAQTHDADKIFTQYSQLIRNI